MSCVASARAGATPRVCPARTAVRPTGPCAPQSRILGSSWAGAISELCRRPPRPP